MAELTCRELVELVTNYFEEALPPAQRARFEAHLEDCQGCRTHLEQMRTTIRLVGVSGRLAARPEVKELLTVFRGWKRSQP